jgi:hypothetical protein
MSPRQFTLMKDFIDHANGYTLDDIRGLSQVTLGSIVYRKWVKQSGENLTITDEGKRAYYEYGSLDITRKNYGAALSRYLKNINGRRK